MTIDPGALKIEEFAAFPFDLPLYEPFRIATTVSVAAQNVLVQLVAGGGLEGWGEASSLHAIAGETQPINLAAAGDRTRIRIDANQGWRRMEAARAISAFAPLDIEFCEQPVRAHDLNGLRYESARSPIPVMADESVFSAADALNIIEADAAPYFNIKLAKSGGIREASRIAALAGAAGIECRMGCMLESRLGITAAAHFALANEVVSFFDLDSFFEHRSDPISGGAQVKNGRIEVADEPGIGARPDPGFMALLGRD